MSDDREVVAQALQDPNKFGELVEKYEGKIDSYLQTILYASKEDREDLSQEIFIAAYRYLNSYKPEYSFSTWLYRIAHNQAISFLRKHKTRHAMEIQAKRALGDENESADILEDVTSDENVEENVAHLLALEEVKAQMQHLSQQEREVLLLRYCEQKGYGEIASILRVPEGTIASIIYRAKAKLKKLVHHEQAQ